MSTPNTPSSSTPIIDNNALTASLRALKLGGMLQTLDARLAQARAGELGHLEFLQVLCHDEISRRETTSIARAPAAPGSRKPSPWKGSTSPPPRNSPPRRSATWPRCAGSRPASR